MSDRIAAVSSQIAALAVSPGARLPPYAESAPGVGCAAVATVTQRHSTGAKLTAARERANLSKRELARRAGVDRRALLRWESGEHVPTAANLLRLIPHIGGTVEAFLTDD